MEELLANWWAAGYIGKSTLIITAIYTAAIGAFTTMSAIGWCVDWIDRRLARHFEREANVREQWVAIPCPGEEEYRSVEDTKEARSTPDVRFFVQVEVPFVNVPFVSAVAEQVYDQLKKGSRAVVRYSIGPLSRDPRIYSIIPRAAR